MIEWGINVHNAVNISHGKKVYGYKDGLQEIIKNSDPIYVPDVPDVPSNTNDNLVNSPSCNCSDCNTSKKSVKSTLTFICILGFLIVLYLILKKQNLNKKLILNKYFKEYLFIINNNMSEIDVNQIKSSVATIKKFVQDHERIGIKNPSDLQILFSKAYPEIYNKYTTVVKTICRKDDLTFFR